ncbi:hypothetical protein [Streptomyces maremycinicus]|uniref:hypothetical protein n=1 Tax=Streptomyces maremycinicus TaxID=1679753 RepID=UPI0013315003|nr:hypothetical protein [Streptomyces sp. NBRC 110468]
MLTYWAVLEIRSMARRRKALTTWPDDDYVACIAWLADLVHNIAGSQTQAPRRISWRKRRRRMSWTWRTAGPAGRTWILETLKKNGTVWTPPSDDRGGSTTVTDRSL